MGSRDHLSLAASEGHAIHEFVAFLASRFGGVVLPSQVVAALPYLDPTGLPPVYAQQMRQRAVTAAATYFRRFARPGWEFIGSEVSVGEVRLDLVWRKDRRVQVDEIKTGSMATEVWSEHVLNQARAQLRAGRLVWGSDFEAVRVVLLMHPRGSYYLTKENQVERGQQ